MPSNDPTTDLDTIREQQAAVDAAYQKLAENDPVVFAKGLWIPSATGKRLFNSCVAPFQERDLHDVGEAFSAVREGVMPPRRRFWIERTKGAAKDSDLAILLAWLLAFPKRPLYLQVGAADRDQAAIVRQRMEDIVFYNPWLQERINVCKYAANSKPGDFVLLEIVAADVGGSHGGTPDVLVINELSHITKWEFVQNLLDNADKVPQGVVVIATNAGFKGTKAEHLRRVAEKSTKKWTVRVLDRPAPWIGKSDLEDAKQRNPIGRYNRLWFGRWASGKGEAINEEDIDAALACHKCGITKPEPGWIYIAGLDLGIAHDHAALVIAGINQAKQRIRLAWMRGWAPGRNRQVDLIDVKEMVLKMFEQFHLMWIGFDPTEARLMAQELRRLGLPMKEVSFASPANLTAMAVTLVQVISQRRLEAFDDDEGRLRRDFGKLNIVDRGNYGFKLESVADEFGHADVGIGLAILMPKAVEMLSSRGGLTEEDSLADGTEGDLSDKEIDDLPEALRDICKVYDDE